jgi:hypothetical protein
MQTGRVCSSCGGVRFKTSRLVNEAGHHTAYCKDCNEEYNPEKKRKCRLCGHAKVNHNGSDSGHGYCYTCDHNAKRCEGFL